MNIQKLIDYKLQEYERLFPFNTALDLKPVTRFLKVEEDPLEKYARLHAHENYNLAKSKWAIKECIDITQGIYFQEIVDIMGNPDHLKPCDGSWHQCSLFCEDFGHCPYEIKKVPEKPKAEEIAVPGSTDSKKRSKKRRKKK